MAFACLALLSASCSSGGPGPPAAPGVIRVPQDAETVPDAVRRAEPGDVVLLDRGTYPGEVVVPEDRPDITIRGVDRNDVVFDGEDARHFAVDVRADGVALENFTAHNYTSNAIVWDSVHGFRGRFLTVWNVGGYGIYAVDSTDGLLSDDLSSGAGNAAFYIGECDPCRTVLTRLVARRSGIGFSGTNASGGLVVRDSVFDRNGTGILPNSYNEEAHPPQSRARFVSNTVRGSGSVPTPASDPLGGFTGLGIGVAGGHGNVISGNTVTGSARYGIVLFPTLQRDGSTWAAVGNTIRDNRVEGSGVADLAVSAGAGRANCFAGNRYGAALPGGLEGTAECPSTGKTPGDLNVAGDLAIPAPVAYSRSGSHPSYRSMPEPPSQPGMPSPIPSSS